MSQRETKTFDDEEQIDLEELTSAKNQSKAAANDREVIQAIAEESSFSSRGDAKKKPPQA